MSLAVVDFVARAKRGGELGGDAPPWAWTSTAAEIVARVTSGGVVVDPTATVEQGATIKGPAWIGPGCLVAAGAYLRGGVWLEENCTIGPGAEVKSSFLFRGVALAHFNFVGDSVLGEDVNLEAGAIIANHRNERADKMIRVRHGDHLIETGVTKFGALVGDGARIGANAVLAPGTILARGEIVPRLALVDQGG